MVQIVEYTGDDVATISEGGVTYRVSRDFISAIGQALSKMMNNPFLMMIYGLAVIDMCDISAKKSVTLLHFFINCLQEAIKSSTSQITISILQAALYIFTFLANYEVILIGQIFVWIPVSFKSDTSSLLVTIIVSFVTVVFSYFSLIETFLFGLFWYLYSELVYTTHKIYIVAMFLVSLYIKFASTKDGVNHMDEHMRHVLAALARYNYSVSKGYDPTHIRSILNVTN